MYLISLCKTNVNPLKIDANKKKCVVFKTVYCHRNVTSLEHKCQEKTFIL